jgi:RHS repeat-associated protein
MTSKDDGTYTATYAYKYADKLASISTDFPGESILSFDYGGDGKRREYTTGGNTNTWYWDAGWNVINYETYTGSKFTYVRHPQDPVSPLLAKWNGTNPTGGGTIWRYYHHDIIRSARMGTRDDKSIVKNYEYTPYGEIYSESGWAHTAWKFTSAHGPTNGLYYFPFRYYSPSLGRWMTRDPIGSLGLYAYVLNNPVAFIDPLGLYEWAAWLRGFGGSIADTFKAAFTFGRSGQNVASQAHTYGGQTLGRWTEGLALAGMGAGVGAVALYAVAPSVAMMEIGWGTAASSGPAGIRITHELVRRAGPSGDDAISQHIIEGMGDATISVTHQVLRGGEIIHQHQQHIGLCGDGRYFPEEWIEYPYIDF